jgi:hypothetical protein
MLVLDMIVILPPLGKYKYDTWRILLVKCYINNLMRLRSWIRNVNSRPRSGVGRPHHRSVGPGLFTASSPSVILYETTLGFGHHEDMYGFWSIWCFSVIWCFWNGRSTKLVKLVSNRHISSISCMKYRYVHGKYMHFLTANISTMEAEYILLLKLQRKLFGSEILFLSWVLFLVRPVLWISIVTIVEP